MMDRSTGENSQSEKSLTTLFLLDSQETGYQYEPINMAPKAQLGENATQPLYEIINLLKLQTYTYTDMYLFGLPDSLQN